MKLSGLELVQLLNFCFPRLEGDKKLAILVDIPKSGQDNPAWNDRRKIAFDWYALLSENLDKLGVEAVDLVAYPDVGSNNADLPEKVYQLNGKLPDKASDLPKESKNLTGYFADTQLFIALTQYSATAPLKVAAKKYNFRAATMPGFTADMIPALRIDFNVVNERLQLLKQKLDFADKVNAEFVVDDKEKYKVSFDLFQRTAHVSSGRFPERGTAGNLPSGETYIVPYEGGLGKVSQSQGYLPVQFGDEVVIYRIRQNKITKVLSDGPKSMQEWDYVRSEPAYANVAELGFGIIADFDIHPIGQVLLDEKLGFHIAFGRSDHFGGIIGPEQFSSPEAVVHIDRIYLPETQPRVRVTHVDYEYSQNKKEVIIKDGQYQLW